MGSLKTIIDELAKQKLLIYFILIWGASMLLYAVCNLGSGGLGIADVYDAICILAALVYLIAGIVLALSAWKLLNLKGITTPTQA